MIPRTSIGIPAEIYCRPLVEILRTKELFEVVLDAPASVAQKLAKRTLKGAFLSPIDFARNASQYRIVPGSAVSSHSGNKSLVLYFRSGARAVRTLAVPPTSSSDIVLAKILLAERFDSEPQIVPVVGGLASMLARADAALLSGEAALNASSAQPESLDLIEEWVAATDLPYVHGFWCGREKGLSQEECGQLSALNSEVAEWRDDSGRENPAPADLFSYDFTEPVQEGIREFLRYAYYHGILPDVPELVFFGSSGADESPMMN
ncbi:MAG TPA: MqnA/MqnD/SBP family protein [Bacteroidota bacterium]|nr:MqnA/MqnD/SBP family protein [Bacteroidota bacterium]